MKTKKQIILDLLARGYAHDVIAVAAKCNPTYVAAVAGGWHQPYERIEHVKMVYGPWTTDRHGNLSREIRGE